MKLLMLLLIATLLSLYGYTQGDNLLNINTFHEIRLTSLNPNDWNNIVNSYESKVYTALQVTIDGVITDSVGVRIKGNSFYGPAAGDNKYQPYRLKFNEFRSNQKYDGLKQVNLHTHDLTQNFLAYDIFRSAHLICPRTSFAKVYFDNTLLGLYMIVDEVEKIYLTRNFSNNNGNLYKADEKGAYLKWLGSDQNMYNQYKLETNETLNDKTDLVALLNSIHNTPDADLITVISANLNFDNFMKSLAIEMYICKGDAFYDSGHNFYLYHNTANNKFEYMTWDLDVSFTSLRFLDLNFRLPFGDQINNDFITKILTNPGLRNHYYSTVCNLINSSVLNSDRISELIDRTEQFLNSNGCSFSAVSDLSLADIKNFVRNRKNQIEANFNQSNYNCLSTTIQNPRSELEIKIYPTPTSDILNLEHTNNNTFSQCEIFDVAGNKVLDYTLNHTSKAQINVEMLPKGIYFAYIYLDNKTTAFRKIMRFF